MKTVLITGATSGFGRGLVKKFLEQGFKVVATGRNLTGRQEILASERHKYGLQLIEKNLDVADSDQIREIAAYFTKNTIDVLVNNAGFAVFGPVEECAEDKIRKQFEVNFFGLVFLTQKLLPALRQSRGHIVNISSVFGFMGFPLSSFYCSSKFALEGFSESLAYELKPFGVKVTLVEPGSYPTNFNNAVEWGMEIKASSPYYKHVQNYTSLREKMANNPHGQNPQEVIDGVVKIAQKRAPKLNYPFGRDALLARVTRKILPRAWFHRLLGFIALKIFTKPLEQTQ